MKIKMLLAITVCSTGLVLTSCASHQKPGTQAYASGKAAYAQQNYGASFQEIQQAAQAGDPDAEYALGYMYYYGKGTPQNTPAAMEWMRKSAAQGQPQAVKALELINNQQNPKVASAAMNSEQPTNANQEFVLANNSNEGNSVGSAQAAAASSADHMAKTRQAFNQANTAVSHSAAKKPTHASNSNITRQRQGYTLQLLGSFNKADAIKFMDAHHLTNKAAFYKTTYQGRDWYVVVYGHYSTYSQAKSALATLPADLQQTGAWVKPMNLVQSGLAENQQAASSNFQG